MQQDGSLPYFPVYMYIYAAIYEDNNVNNNNEIYKKNYRNDKDASYLFYFLSLPN